MYYAISTKRKMKPKTVNKGKHGNTENTICTIRSTITSSFTKRILYAHFFFAIRRNSENEPEYDDVWEYKVRTQCTKRDKPGAMRERERKRVRERETEIARRRGGLERGKEQKKN